MSSGPSPSDVLEERLIDAEYKIWKKNTPFLYDFVLTHSLEWPSLTVEWLPPPPRTTTTTTTTTTSMPMVQQHELLLGTHTSPGEQNYLMVATCILPENTEVAAVTDNNSNSNTDEATTTAAVAAAAATPSNAIAATTTLRYDDERKELGGYGDAGADVGKIEIRMKIKHEGEVNRARHMPQNHFIVATRGPSKEVYIWDLTKHTSFPTEQSPVCPQATLQGHEAEGYAMAWSPHQEGHLLTGAEDTVVQLWDVRTAYTKKQPGAPLLTPLRTLKAHTATVEDVAWHAHDPHMAGSVGDDRRICVWDVRTETNNQTVRMVEQAHGGDINCIAFHPVNEHLLATGSADASIHIWDLRVMDKGPVSKLLAHTDQVFKVEWSPMSESILGSCSADRRVALWDLSRIGQEQAPEDAEDGPPELLFLHGGHTSKVSDFNWLPGDWTIASVSEDNILQVWNPAEEIYADDNDDDDDEDVKEEDGVLGEDELE